MRLPPPYAHTLPTPAHTRPYPSHTPGTEKREKMAVMEAAISSTLAHPNIVATYTYSIKPVRDTTKTMANEVSQSVSQCGPPLV